MFLVLVFFFFILEIIFIHVIILVLVFFFFILEIIFINIIINNTGSLVVTCSPGNFLHLGDHVLFLSLDKFFMCWPGLFSLHHIRNILSVKLLSLISSSINNLLLKHVIILPGPGSLDWFLGCENLVNLEISSTRNMN